MAIHPYDSKKLAQDQLVFYSLSVSVLFLVHPSVKLEEVVPCGQASCSNEFPLQQGKFVTYPTKFKKNDEGMLEETEWGHGAFCSHECCLKAMPLNGLHWA